jgi:hypothetical protein
VCLGDDSCDEGDFEYVNAAGGLSVAVNVERPTAARARLPSIGDARDWLHALGAYSGKPNMRSSAAITCPGRSEFELQPKNEYPASAATRDPPSPGVSLRISG